MYNNQEYISANFTTESIYQNLQITKKLRIKKTRLQEKSLHSD